MEENEKERIRKDINDFLDLLSDNHVKEKITEIVKWEKEGKE